MKTVHLLIALCLMAAALLTAGCMGNATNEPSAADVQKYNDRRAAAIDADPSLTPEGREKMKEMLHLKGNAPPQKR